MSFPRRSGWLPAALSLIALTGLIAVSISLVSLPPAKLTIDVFVALVSAHTLGLAVFGATTVASGARALRELRATHAGADWSLSDSLETRRKMHRAV